MKSDAGIYSCFLESGKTVSHAVKAARGCYLYVLEIETAKVNDYEDATLGAAMITDEPTYNGTAERDSELLLVDVLLS